MKQKMNIAMLFRVNVSMDHPADDETVKLMMVMVCYYE